MKNYNEEFVGILSTQIVDEFAERVEKYLSHLSFSKKDAMRYVLSVEELLLKTLDSKDDNVEIPVKLVFSKRFFTNYIYIYIDGKKENIFASDENSSEIGNNFLQTIGLSPEYNFSEDRNTYTFKIKKKQTNPVILLGITVVAAIIVNFLGMLVPETTRNGIANNFFVPVHETFLNLLTCIAGPLIFLSVAWGIYGIGDAGTLKKVGGKIIKTYFAALILIITVLGAASVPFFNLNYSKRSSGKSGFGEIIDMIKNFVPSNIVEPFYTKNTIQIIFMAGIFGIALIVLGKKTDLIARFVEQVNSVVQFLIEMLCKILPIFIFVVLVEMFWSGSTDILPKIAKAFGIFLIAVFLHVVIIVLYVSAMNKINPIVLVKKGLPSLIIAMTTASSAATFNTNIKMCIDSLGIDEKITSFSLPLGIIIYKASTGLGYLMIALFLSEYYKVNVSIPWFITLFITIIILSFATPPIPGGGASAYAVIFALAGIPSHAVAIALSCEAIFDFFATGTDQFAIPLLLFNQSKKLGLVDEKVLKDKG